MEEFPRAYGFYTAVGGIVGLLVVSLAHWVFSTLRPRNFPPGPPVIPGLGNLHQIPPQKPYLKFHSWAKQYGDLVSLKTGASNLVVINNPLVVHELFEKRGAIYSNRPDMYVVRNYVFPGPEDKAVAVLQYDEYYRRWRKTFQYILSNAGVTKVLPLLEAEASFLSRRFLDAGANYKDAVRAWSLAVPLVATTGQRLDDLPKGYADHFFQSQEDFLRLMIPGAGPPVDVFPILKYVPELFASWKRESRRVRKVMLEDAWRFVKDGKAQYARMEDGSSAVRFEGLIAKLLREQNSPESTKKERAFSDLELGYIGQAAVGAAVDTTAATFESLMYCFAAFPHVLKKAQAEVDSIAGTTPPAGEQMGDLPYLKACICEVLRWRPTTPSALPHTLAKDDRYGDFVFPKGTTFIANVWTIQRSEEYYERPEEYIPERFIDHPFGYRPDKASDISGLRALSVFGFGRRQCPGEQFAFTTLMLAVSKAIWAFDVLPPKGGVDMNIETGFKDGIVTEPVDPTVVLKLRDASREAGILEETARTEHLARAMLE